MPSISVSRSTALVLVSGLLALLVLVGNRLAGAGAAQRAGGRRPARAGLRGGPAAARRARRRRGATTRASTGCATDRASPTRCGVRAALRDARISAGSTSRRRSWTARRCSFPRGVPAVAARSSGWRVAGAAALSDGSGARPAAEAEPRDRDGRAARRAPRGGACHRAEDPRLSSRARLHPIGRRPGRRARNRPGADRAAARPRDPVRRVVELHWPALLAGSACAGLAASNWVHAGVLCARRRCGALLACVRGRPALVATCRLGRRASGRSRSACCSRSSGSRGARSVSTRSRRARSPPRSVARVEPSSSSSAARAPDVVGRSRPCGGRRLRRAAPPRACPARPSARALAAARRHPGRRSVRIAEPRAAEDGGFDERAWLARQGIHVVARARAWEQIGDARRDRGSRRPAARPHRGRGRARHDRASPRARARRRARRGRGSLRERSATTSERRGSRTCSPSPDRTSRSSPAGSTGSPGSCGCRVSRASS